MRKLPKTISELEIPITILWTLGVLSAGIILAMSHKERAMIIALNKCGVI